MGARNAGIVASHACAVRTIYDESCGRKRGTMSTQRLGFPLNMRGAALLILAVVFPPRYMLGGAWGLGQDDPAGSAPGTAAITPRGTLDDSSDSAPRYEALLQKAA